MKICEFFILWKFTHCFFFSFSHFSFTILIMPFRECAEYTFYMRVPLSIKIGSLDKVKKWHRRIMKKYSIRIMGFASPKIYYLLWVFNNCFMIWRFRQVLACFHIPSKTSQKLRYHGHIIRKYILFNALTVRNIF